MIPSANCQTGQVLRLMIDGKARSAIQVCEGIGVHPASAITARIRDLRKIGVEIDCSPRPSPGKTIYEYRLTRCPRWIQDELNREHAEEQQEVAA